MQLVIDTAKEPRKAIATEVLGRDDEPQFSKMVGGVRPWDLDHFDTLPRELRIKWLTLMGEADGLEVRDLDVVETAYRMVALWEQLSQVARVMRLPELAQRMAKVETEQRQPQDRRKSA